jgi:hypothetical protein
MIEWMKQHIEKSGLGYRYKGPRFGLWFLVGAYCLTWTGIIIFLAYLMVLALT